MKSGSAIEEDNMKNSEQGVIPEKKNPCTGLIYKNYHREFAGSPEIINFKENSIILSILIIRMISCKNHNVNNLKLTKLLFISK
jgi:hypothetical protein